MGVGELAESLPLPGCLVSAAWLHDIGYAPELVVSGFHALDGARYLLGAGAPLVVVGLVGHHTGASVEAEERGLRSEFEELPAPPCELLHVLTLLDLSVGPDGRLTRPASRIAEILARYPQDHPVHRAVDRSAPALLKAAQRAQADLNLPGSWPVEPWAVLPLGEREVDGRTPKRSVK